MARIGYQPGTNVVAFDTTSTTDSLNQRASEVEKMTEHGWAYRISARLGRVTATSPRVKLSIWKGDNGPAALLETTQEFSVGTSMTSVSTGAVYAKDLVNPVKMQAGVRYCPGFNANDARIAYGYIPKANLATGNIYDLWQRTVASGPTPQDPFGPTSSRDDYGWMAIWIDYEPNVPPNPPSGMTPSNGAFVAGTKPTFKATFSDNNQTLPNGDKADSLAKYQIFVWNSNGGAVWNSGIIRASQEENETSKISYYWDNNLLQDDKTYSWSIKVWDQFDAAMSSSLNTFTVGAGYIEPQNPHGRQTSRTPGPWTGVWHNAFGETLTHVRIQIQNRETGSIIRETADISVGTPKTNGQSFSLSWAQLNETQLPYDSKLQWRAMGKTNTPSYTNYSGWVTFEENAPPTVPRIYSPGLSDGTLASSSRPIITAGGNDPDQLPGSGWQMFVRIKDANGTVLFTREMSYLPAESFDDGAVFAYQTTATDLPSFGDYRFDAWSYDGYLYSGGNDVQGANMLSDEVTFTYRSGPVVQNIFPAEGGVIGTDEPRYDWNVPGTQIRYRVRVYPWGYGTAVVPMIYDSREVTTTQEFHDQPGGYLENFGNYYRVIDVWDDQNKQGTSDAFHFSVEFGAAHDITNFVASPHRARYDHTPTSVLLSWDQSDYDTDEFVRYIITRQADSETLFEVDDQQTDVNRRIAEITSKSQTTFVDYLPASGVTYTYRVKQQVRVGSTTVTSDSSAQEITLSFVETVICDARHGGARRAVLPYRTSRDIPREFDREARRPWGSRAPMYRKTKRFNRKITTDYYISPESGFDVAEIINELDKLAYYGGPMCYRDGRGRRYFGEIEDFQEKDDQGGRPRIVTISFGQSNAAEEKDVT